MKIMVVEDDPEMIGALKRGLSYEGFSVDIAETGEEALEKFPSTKPDLIILDIMLPGIDGIKVSKRLRQITDVPILMLTARGTVADRVNGLDSGADDYLIKPFAFDELLARIRALSRRYKPVKPLTYTFGDLVLNTVTREVTRNGKLLELTVQEFNLLELFMRHPGQVLQKSVIYESVWGFDFEGESNVLDVYISYLRSKLEQGNQSRLIHTVRGVGFVLKE